MTPLSSLHYFVQLAVSQSRSENPGSLTKPTGTRFHFRHTRNGAMTVLESVNTAGEHLGTADLITVDKPHFSNEHTPVCC